MVQARGLIQVLARVVTHVLARAIMNMHVHGYYLKTCVLGAYSDQFLKNSEPRNTPKECFFFRKEVERGWESGAGSLSWKSGWKPWSTRYEYFGTSWSKKSLLVSKQWPFEDAERVQITFPLHILGPAKLKILRTNCPFECGGGAKSYLGNAQMNVDFDSVGLPWVWEL